MCMVGCIKLESSLQRQTLRLKLSLESGRELVCLTVYPVSIWQLGFAQYCISLVPACKNNMYCGWHLTAEIPN